MRRYTYLALTLALAGAAAVLASLTGSGRISARLAKPIPYVCDPVANPCLAVRNESIRADISPSGSWASGTTGGDPSTPNDDDKTLVYGFKPGGASELGSSYTTVRIVGRDSTRDIAPTTKDVVSQFKDGDRVHTVWHWTDPHQVSVTETLRLVDNPFSGRRDATAIDYVVANDGSTSTKVGIRALVDVKLGRNDGAPYIVPGVGAVTTERDFVAADVPPFWQAFESPTYDPRELRSVGLLDSHGMTVPDRFVIAYWFDIQDKLWDYPVDVTKPITRDSAVALYWGPKMIPPGGQIGFTTGYGLAGDRGGSAFLSGPVNARCGDTVPVSLFVTNFETVELTGGEATLTLPPDLALAAGESATKPIPPISPGDTGSAVWQVDVGPAALGQYALSAVAHFDTDREFTAGYTLTVTCPQNTPVPTPKPSDTPSPTSPPTKTPVPTTTATPGDGARACDFIKGRVPPAVIAAALANPTRVQGWNLLMNPSAPESVYNQRRRMLSLQNIGVPYHMLYNPVVYKAGCP